jgi:filamentous hemagglutinin family protein
MKSQSLFTILLFILSLQINAQITLDGTLGPGGVLSGADYLIGSDLGQQQGGNLFHSFQAFNLQSHESATFSGPSSVSSIISRVTGGNPSQIDGLIRSTIPNADMYFLNPYGVIFGPNAQLDVQGSFHASTADYLRLGNGGRFDARQPNNSLLTVAPVEAFGFLTDLPATLSLEGSQLSTHPKTTISLIGGRLVAKGAQLKIAHGHINLVSVGSTGEAILTDEAFDLTSFNRLNHIAITDNSIITTSGKGAGDIYIRGEELYLQESRILANALEQGEKGEIYIQVDRLNLIGNNSLGEILKDKIQFDTAISSSTVSDGEGGDINIWARDSINITNAAIFANSGKIDIHHEEGSTTPSLKPSGTQGHAGTISIETDQLTINNGVIESNAFDEGNGGNIFITVTGKTSLSNAHIGVNAFESTEMSANRVGEIILVTKELDLTNVILSSNTIGNGTGGNIVLEVDGPIMLHHSAITADAHTMIRREPNEPPPIDNTMEATQPPPIEPNKPAKPKRTKPSGDAGTIFIEAQKLTLTDRSHISSNTDSTGNGGNITIYATDSVTIQNPHNTQDPHKAQESKHFKYKKQFGIESASLSKQDNSGNAGEIWLETQRLIITDNVDINTSSQGGGDAGHIYLAITDLDLSHQSQIASSNRGSGNAGNIMIDAQNQIRLQESQITTEAASAQGGDIFLNTGELVYLLHGKITTSVKGGTGDGGNIFLENPDFVTLNHAQIKAQAFQGKGGNIQIQSGKFIPSSDSLVSASSKLGIDGMVNIVAPDENLTDGLLALPATAIEESVHISNTCENMTYEEYTNRSSFEFFSLAGVAGSPYDLKPSRLSRHLAKSSHRPAAYQESSIHKTFEKQIVRPVAMLTVCYKKNPTEATVRRTSVIPEEPLF